MLRFLSFCQSVLFMAALFLSFSTVASAQADDPEEVVWVQIEAQQSLARATDRARAYTTLLQDVNGFAVGGGWYAVVVGPYRREDAELVLRQYREDGLIPRDSFVQVSNRLGQQYWPVGANVLGNGAVAAPEGTVPTTPEQPAEEAPAQAVETPQVAEVAPVPEPEPEPEAADETPAEAQRSEQALSRDEKKELQVMLQWAGYYDAAIDGSFGRGTRNSMAAWQESKNYEKTGILTTLQRAALKKDYNAVLEGLGLQVVRDAQAGIEMIMPTAAVTFDRY